MVNQTINDFGQIDVLINNAGIVREEKQVPIWEITDTAWKLGIDTNLTGSFYCARSVTRHMVERGQGKIINVASASGLRGVRDMYMYCCAKGGVIQLTHTLAVSLGRYGVTANSIVPGYIPTQGTQGMQERLPREEFIPVGHSGQPEDTGPVFLASNASDYINGAMFTLDGGALAGGFAPTGHSPTIPLGA
jgi:2-deoxy-D-gluconate 3-dehydrogenase